jgi:ribose 5-phosphate isomerase B
MRIAIGGDHAGFQYKKEIIALLNAQAQVTDFGPMDETSCDYPDFAHPVAAAVAAGEADFGILICGSGNGVCIAANKHAKVRAALCWDIELASLARQHNNANVLCIPARFVDLPHAKRIVLTFLSTDFEGGRHQRRVDKIDI